jgi:hypothetical protein
MAADVKSNFVHTLSLDRKTTLLHINANDGYDCKTSETTPVFVLDVSYSMGNEYINQIGRLKYALTKAGFNDSTPIHVILFGRDIHRRITTVGGLSNLPTYIENNCDQRSTYMARGENNVASYFLDSYLQIRGNILLITVSDGDVFDINSFRSEIERIRPLIDCSRIITMGCRIGFNGTNTGSTEAIAILGILSNNDFGIVDFQGNERTRITDYATNNPFISFLNNNRCRERLTITGGTLRQYIDTPPRTEIMFNPQKGFTFLVNHEEGTPITLAIDGITLTFTSNMISEQALNNYIQDITRRVKMAKVSGIDVTQSLRVINDFQQLLFNAINNAYTEQEQKEEKIVNENSAIIRMRNLQRTMRKGWRTAIFELRAALNTDRISQMNSQQQADWIQSLEDTKQTRRLARRVGEFDEKNALAVRAGLKGLLNHLNTTDFLKEYSEFNGVSSWYTCDSMYDILLEFKNMTPETIDECSIVELMSIIGCFGPCIESPRDAYPDPYGFKIRKLFFSFLNNVDLYQAFADGNGKPLLAPGQQQSTGITGIIPILDSKCLPLMKYLAPILGCHASFAMRGRPETVPGDLLGLWGATIVKIFKHPITEASARALVGIINNIREYFRIYRPYGDIIENLVKTDPGRFFTGDNGISGLGKLIVCILASGIQVTSELAHAMFYFRVYHWCRRISKSTEPQTRITSFLQLPEGGDQEVTALFEDNPPPISQHIVDCKQYHRDLRGLHPPGLGSISLLNTVSQCFHENGNDEDAIVRGLTSRLSNPSEEAQLFGITNNRERNMYIMAAVIEMLHCPDEKSRIDKKDGKTLYRIIPPSDVESYLNNRAREHLNADYLRRVALKEQKEALINRHRVLVDISHSTLADFEAKVPMVVTSRNGQDHDILMDLLMDLSDAKVMNRLEKLGIMLLARSHNTKETLLTPVLDRDGNPTGDTKSWLNGMAYNKSLHAIRKVFEAFGGSGKNAWNNMISWKNDNIIDGWIYRESDIPNRHGHCTSNPSEWALNYRNLWPKLD